MEYTITAYFHNSDVRPLLFRVKNKLSALNLCLGLVKSNNYTVISCTTPDSLEVFRFWGQMADLP